MNSVFEKVWFKQAIGKGYFSIFASFIFPKIIRQGCILQTGL